MTSQKFGELVQTRKQAFREEGGPGVPVSTSLLANYFGAQAEAAAALEDAATRVWLAHMSSQSSTRGSKNEQVMFHARDLVIFKNMMDRGEIVTLARAHRQNDFWREAQAKAQ